MDPLDLEQLKINLPRIQAQDQIRNQSYDAMNPDAVYELYLLAYGDEDIAQKAMKKSTDIVIDSKVEQ